MTLRYRKLDTLLPAIVVTALATSLSDVQMLTFCIYSFIYTIFIEGIGGFVSLNSADPDEMLHVAAFHLGFTVCQNFGLGFPIHKGFKRNACSYS